MPYWATDPTGFEQVGCVYTAQGFEYDYAGVTMGADLGAAGTPGRPALRPTFDTQVKHGTPEHSTKRSTPPTRCC